MKTQTKALYVFGEFFTDRPSIDIFIIQKNVTTNEN